jgi:hypothetical protein
MKKWEFEDEHLKEFLFDFLIFLNKDARSAFCMEELYGKQFELIKDFIKSKVK